MVNKLLDKLYNKYNLEDEDIKFINKGIKGICNHPEFVKRCQKPYMHHDQTTLGEHILEDTIMTYILSQKYRHKKSYDLNIALKIAMFHDLYTDPWQNTVYPTKFLNKHGFRHPLEAAVNVLNWYPDYFEDDYESLKILDGIIHHMYPLPVSRFDKLSNKAELINYKLANSLSDYHKKLLYQLTNRGKIGRISFSKSKFLEGRMVSKADKKVSISNYKGSKVVSVIALVSGKNKHIK